jgi:UPF0042 nucleotide-binding protein
MQFIIISGRSGSGKTTVLQVLEDLSYYCVDNLPVALLPNLAEQIKKETASSDKQALKQVAVGIDARNLASQLGNFSEIFQQLQTLKIDCKIIFLDSNDATLMRRFNASRRKHPLSNDKVSLIEAISNEEQLLSSIEALAELSIDTSTLTIHQLREAIKQYIYQSHSQQTSILIQSFSYKHGIPIDTDFVFDVRCITNPHWQDELKKLTGLDQAVKDFLSIDQGCSEMVKDICDFLLKWIPQFEKNNRSYLTVAIGCTGGQHRSVYITEQVAKELQINISKIQTRHRELSNLSTL